MTQPTQKTSIRLPLKHQVTGIFIPVADVARARAWYQSVLGLSPGEILFGHLCCIELDGGPTLLLDQQLTPEGASAAQRGGYPLFMFATDDIHASLERLRAAGVEIVEYGGQAVQNGHWFNFKDCEGNLLMACGPSA
ncbi:MAG TPA: VOC family protein [Limnochordia bacterium]|nr:VOC family protein [Limnochordia bacterium]